MRGQEELKLITEYLGIDSSVVEKPGNTSNRMVGKEEEKYLGIESKKAMEIDSNIMLEETRPGILKPEHGNLGSSY